MNERDIVVIGGGHAAIEAALAGARMGFSVLLVTLDKTRIGQMSCNPAVGGVGKGQAVREVDALGGEMAHLTDRAGCQFKMLNRGKGPAMWSPRAQCDRALYREAATAAVLSQPGLTVLEDEVVAVREEGGRATGVETRRAGFIPSRAVVVSTGTFMNGLLHRGLRSFPGGRLEEPPSIGLSDSLRALGFEVGRLKTGTPPRLDGSTIDYSKCERAAGDDPPIPFSHFTRSLPQPMLDCRLTRTTERTHDIIRRNLDRSPLYTGLIRGTGPRYCPSIEDKVVKFAHHSSHLVFLEPEGYRTNEVYPNGISTSLPEDVQEELVRSIPGLEDVKIIRHGYAVEYDFCPPTQLRPSLETKAVRGLYFAGQINGTTGYEEAAGQGLIAGINAALSLRGEKPLLLRRDEAYIGVMIDDLVTKGCRVILDAPDSDRGGPAGASAQAADEPYRLMTSRAEWRLNLRWDNADLRLMDHGRRVGLLSENLYDRFLEYRRRVSAAVRAALPEAAAEAAYPFPGARSSSGERPDAPSAGPAAAPDGDSDGPAWDEAAINRQVTVERQYWGYMKRQRQEILKARKLEDRRIPDDADYDSMAGLLTEARQKLKSVRPVSIGQAARIPGVNPSDVSILLVHLERRRRTAEAAPRA